MKKVVGSFGMALLLALSAQSPAIAGEHKHHHGHDMKAMKQMSEQKAVDAVGVIHQIDASERVLKIQHEPIADWNMGAMRMKFHAAPGVDLSNLKEGQKIKFKTSNPKVGRYVVTEIVE
ncbi:MAG: copper-binding protein [Motiliproteus sp.]|nr:copper-binding protein [Motiliproteus sp.]MCW9053357.1 copper-binding protein [Motiliproteus sp.]